MVKSWLWVVVKHRGVRMYLALNWRRGFKDNKRDAQHTQVNNIARVHFTTPTVDRLLEALPLTPPTTVPPTGGSPGSAPASPAPASPAPAGPPAPAPVTPYTARGQLVAPDLLGQLGLGLTVLGGAGGGCGPSATQGLDALKTLTGLHQP